MIQLKGKKKGKVAALLICPWRSHLISVCQEPKIDLFSTCSAGSPVVTSKSICQNKYIECLLFAIYSHLQMLLFKLDILYHLHTSQYWILWNWGIISSAVMLPSEFNTLKKCSWKHLPDTVFFRDGGRLSCNSNWSRSRHSTAITSSRRGCQTNTHRETWATSRHIPQLVGDPYKARIGLIRSPL